MTLPSMMMYASNCFRGLALVLVALTAAQAQVLTGDAKGNSTLLLPGGTVGFNFQEQAFEVAYNAFRNVRLGNLIAEAPVDKNSGRRSWSAIDTKKVGESIRKARLVWGANARAKAENGLAEVFGGGNVAPSARLGFHVGLSWLGALNDTTQERIDSYFRSASRSALLAQGYKEEFKGEVMTKLRNLAGTTKLAGHKVDQLTQEAIDTIDNHPVPDWSAVFKEKSGNPSYWVSNKNDSSEVKKFYDALAFETEKLYQSKYVKEVNPAVKAFNKDLDAIKAYRAYWQTRQTLYLNAGLTGLGFKYLEKPINALDLTGSINNKVITGFFANLGYNWHWGGKLIAGGSVGAERRTSFDSRFKPLTKAAYSLAKPSVKDSAKNTLASSESLTMYTGQLEYYWLWNLNADLAWILKFEDCFTLMPGAYVRHRMPVKGTELDVNTTDLGVNAFFFKDDGPFSGGLYLQFDDVFDNGQRLRDNQRLSLGERWRFGIRANVNIATLFGY